MTVCAGMALGRLGIHFLKRSAGWAWAAGTCVTLAFLAVAFVAAWAGQGGSMVFFAMRFGTGLGAGMIFPNLIQTEDERFDDEAQTAMAGLLPVVQSMSGGSKVVVCAAAMTALAICMGVFLAFASKRITREKGG